MKRDAGSLLRYAGILALILVISIFHYETSTSYRYLHEIYQRVYYIPIVLAAFWYGPLLGMVASVLTSLVYAYHIQRDWTNFPVYSFNQYAEILLYNVMALLIGFLSLRERKHRRILENTSRELSEAYLQLQNTFEQLKKSDRLAALGQLSAGIAHEIRNPLGSIKGSVEILEGEIPKDNPKHEFVRIIKEETARLNSIVAEFLSYARPPKPSVAPVSVNDLIDSTLLLAHNQAERSRVTFRKRYDTGLPPAYLDAGQIRQVLLNIVLNGIEAMPAGGELEARSMASGAGFVVEISDTGEGIGDDALDHVFDPFFTTKTHGTGLGLSISYQLVENHGGRISAIRNPDKGTTFRIELPFKNPGEVGQGFRRIGSLGSPTPLR